MALNVILLEDDPEDESLTLQIIDELQLKINISFVSHSNELFTHLNQQSPIDLIMVDMNAKPDNGLEVLRRLKSDKNFNAIPIVILTDIADQKPGPFMLCCGSEFYCKETRHLCRHKRKD